MAMREGQEPCDPHASKDADASAASADNPGNSSDDPPMDILPPARIDVAPGDEGRSCFAAPIVIDAAPFASSTPRLYAFVIASIAAGMIVGFLFGSRAGVKDAIEAGADINGPAMSKALSWKQEIASGAAERQEIARLTDEVRSLRAQLESMRHGGEALRAAERLRALETARDADREAGRAHEKAIASASARIEKIETRLDLIERAKIDRAPTGSVPKPDRDRPARGPDARGGEAGVAEQKARRSNPAPGGYVLRDIAGDLALIERTDGLLAEVGEGDVLPGAGRVTAIERRAQGWVVVTSRGVIAQRPYR